jgi:protocatechuate 3,4-dioxygenase beta subunit
MFLHTTRISRRQFGRLGLVVAAVAATLALGGTSAALAQALQTTPAQTAGPYFKPGSPERTSLVDESTPGTRLFLTGRVLDPSGQPVAGALLDFWQADAGGAYDNRGYGMRGHQYTDEAGQYQLETVVPGVYPGRTRHIHVRVQAPNGPVLTTQLYFPGEPGNASDSIFNSALVLPIQETPDGATATFDFVVPTGAA